MIQFVRLKKQLTHFMTQLAHLQTNETDRDIKILAYVLNHPGSTRAEVAKKTKISDSTVQRRLAALQESGDVTNQFVLGPENRLYRTRALIGVKLKTAGLESVDYNYRNQKEMVCFIKWGLVEYREFSALVADVVLERVEQAFGGPYELVIFVAALNPNALAAFVTGVIQKLPGVIETTTSLVVSYSKSVWKSPKTSGENKS